MASDRLREAVRFSDLPIGAEFLLGAWRGRKTEATMRSSGTWFNYNHSGGSDWLDPNTIVLPIGEALAAEPPVKIVHKYRSSRGETWCESGTSPRDYGSFHWFNVNCPDCREACYKIRLRDRKERAIDPGLPPTPAPCDAIAPAPDPRELAVRELEDLSAEVTAQATWHAVGPTWDVGPLDILSRIDARLAKLREVRP